MLKSCSLSERKPKNKQENEYMIKPINNNNNEEMKKGAQMT